MLSASDTQAGAQLDFKRKLALILGLIALPLAGSVISQTFAHPSHEGFANIPLHTLMEGQGGFACVALALLMLFLDPQGESSRRDAYHIVAASLIFSGIADSFHAAAPPGNSFVALRSLSTFGGGLILSGLWKPSGLRIPVVATLIVVAVALIVGVVALAAPDAIPAMLHAEKFTVFAIAINGAGGAGYLAGAVALLSLERRTGRIPTLLIGTFCLFGAAGLLFAVSDPWKADWWWWHLVRYAASLLILTQFALTARKLRKQILRDRDTLDARVNERTAEFTQANAKLQKTAEDLGLYRYMLEKATTAVYLINAEGTLLYVNACAAEYAGYTREELTGKHIGLINPTHSESNWRERWAKIHALAPGELDVSTLRHRRKDGTGYSIEVFAHHITHEGKDFQLSMGMDITERQKAEQRLARVNSLSDQALRLTQASYWVIPLDNSGYYDGTQRNAEIFGDPPAPGWRYPIAHWKSCVEAADKNAAERTYEAFLKFVSGESPVYDVVYPYRRPIDSKTVWIHSLGALIPNKTTGISEVHGVNQDITEIMEAKRELESARTEAEKANRLKSEFLANMSHEIRTPMNAILGYAQLMQRDPSLPRPLLAQVETINRAGEHLLALINDILEMSKIEAGRITLNPAAFDLESMVDGLVKLYEARALAKGLTLELRRLPGMPRFVVTDEGKLRQSLLNLLGNAIKFTPTGGVTLTADAEAGTDGSYRLRFAVADTGPGIPAEEIKKLFRAFVQSTAGASAGGTGLGLALSKNYAQLMGGDITVASEPGHGSTFTLTILASPAGESAVAAHTENPMPLRLSAGQPEVRILIADDIVVNRELTAALLTPLGFTTRTAENGAIAVELFQSWKPHAILMDMRMPVMDGYEANRRIKALPGGGDTVIIALTASAFEEEKSLVIASGADGFVRKPFKHEELVAMLGEKLRLRYDYADTPAPADARQAAPSGPIVLADELCTGFTKACAEADYDKLLELCDALGKTDGETAARLRERIDAFDYEGLLRLITP